MPILPWYTKLEQTLDPAQELVSILLVGIIIVSFLMLFSKSNTTRTAWTVYVLMP